MADILLRRMPVLQERQMMDSIIIRDIRSGGYFWVATALIRRDGPKLGPYGIAVYCALASYASPDEQRAWPAVTTIATAVGCSVRQVQRSLHRLEELGWIRREENMTDRGQTSNIYYLLDVPAEHPDDSGGAPQSPPRCTTVTPPVTHSHPPGDSQSPKQESIEQESDEQTPDHGTDVPEGADNLTVSSSKKKPPYWGDLVAETISALNLPRGVAVRVAEQLAGVARRGERAAHNCNPPASPGDITAFARWYRREHPGVNLPVSAEALAIWWHRYQQIPARVTADWQAEKEAAIRTLAIMRQQIDDEALAIADVLAGREKR